MEGMARLMIQTAVEAAKIETLLPAWSAKYKPRKYIEPDPLIPRSTKAMVGMAVMVK